MSIFDENIKFTGEQLCELLRAFVDTEDIPNTYREGSPKDKLFDDIDEYCYKHYKITQAFPFTKNPPYAILSIGRAGTGKQIPWNIYIIGPGPNEATQYLWRWDPSIKAKERGYWRQLCLPKHHARLGAFNMYNMSAKIIPRGFTQYRIDYQDYMLLLAGLPWLKSTFEPEKVKRYECI
jgi:hypothetical protein